MTLDEAIIHAREKADELCDECGKQHRQLADWLEELKNYRFCSKEAYGVFDNAGNLQRVFDSEKNAEEFCNMINHKTFAKTDDDPISNLINSMIPAYGYSVKRLVIDTKIPSIDTVYSFVVKYFDNDTLTLSSSRIDDGKYFFEIEDWREVLEQKQVILEPRIMYGCDKALWSKIDRYTGMFGNWNQIMFFFATDEEPVSWLLSQEDLCNRIDSQIKKLRGA